MSQEVYGTLCHMLTAFQNSFTIRRSSQFAIIIVITYATACQTCYHTTLWNIWQFDTVLTKCPMAFYASSCSVVYVIVILVSTYNDYVHLIADTAL